MTRHRRRTAAAAAAAATVASCCTCCRAFSVPTLGAPRQLHSVSIHGALFPQQHLSRKRRRAASQLAAASTATAGDEQAAKEVEVVLSDWLLEDDQQQTFVVPSTPPSPYWNSGQFLERLSLRQAGIDAVASGRGGGGSSAPFRFQRLVSSMWAELRKDGAMEYLGAQGQVTYAVQPTVRSHCALALAAEFLHMSVPPLSEHATPVSIISAKRCRSSR